MKKEEKTELTKERILTAAMEEFGEKGYAAAALNNICAAGIPKGLLYHNYENKDALYLACVKRSFSDLLKYLKEKGSDMGLQEYMEARLLFFQEKEKQARLFFEALLQPPAALSEQIGECRREFDEWNRMLYRQLLSGLNLRKDVTEEEAMEYFTLMQTMFNGYFSSPACNGLPFSDIVRAHESKLSGFLDYMLYGIAERGKRE